MYSKSMFRKKLHFDFWFSKSIYSILSLLYVIGWELLTFMVSDVPGTDAARLFEIRREEIVDDVLVFGGRQRRGGRADRGHIVGSPWRRGRAMLSVQEHDQQQPDGSRTLFPHFHRVVRRGNPSGLSLLPNYFFT